jgi:hypothetical protein
LASSRRPTLQQGALGIEHALKVDEPRSVLAARQLRGLPGGVGGSRQSFPSDLLFAIRHKRIFHFFAVAARIKSATMSERRNLRLGGASEKPKTSLISRASSSTTFIGGFSIPPICSASDMPRLKLSSCREIWVY